MANDGQKENKKKSTSYAHIKATDIQLAEAITASNGILTGAIQYLKTKYEIDLDRHTLAIYISKSEELRQCALNAKEKIKDKAESVVLKAMASDDEKIALSASQFYLKTQGKDRGYTTGSEVKGDMVLTPDVSRTDKVVVMIKKSADGVQK